MKHAEKYWDLRKNLKAKSKLIQTELEVTNK